MRFAFPSPYRIFSTMDVYYNSTTGSFTRDDVESAVYVSLFGGQNVNIMKAVTINS